LSFYPAANNGGFTPVLTSVRLFANNNKRIFMMQTASHLFNHYQFDLQFKKQHSFNNFSGSAWRGLLGHSLKKTACTTGLKTCDTCLLKSNCAYHYIFETKPPSSSDRMRKYESIPHPFVIKNISNTTVNKNKNLALEIKLIGKANNYLPYIIQSFMQAGKKGIGKEKTPFLINKLNKWTETHWEEIWNPSKNQLEAQNANTINIPSIDSSSPIVKVSFLTPMNLVNKGQIVKAKDFKFSKLIRSITRRVSMLMYFHCDTELQVDYKDIHQQAEKIDILQSQLKNTRWIRYSNRQKQRMFVDGISGEFYINLSQSPELWNFLYLGSQIHTGKFTSMGLGEMKIENVVSLPKQ